MLNEKKNACIHISEKYDRLKKSNIHSPIINQFTAEPTVNIFPPNFRNKMKYLQLNISLHSIEDRGTENVILPISHSVLLRENTGKI